MKVLAAADEVLNSVFHDVLGDTGVQLTTIEPHNDSEIIISALQLEIFDLAIVTNSDFSPFKLPELISQIKSEHPRIRVIAICGYNTPELRDKIMASGAEIFIDMPFKYKKLQQLLTG